MNIEFVTAMKTSTISPSTQSTYASNYKRFMKLTADKPVLLFTETALVKELKTIEAPPMSVNGIISICMLIRKSVHLTNKKLEKYRTELVAKHYENKEISNSEVLIDKLATINDIATYVAQQLSARDYTSFIINFLLFKFGLRNADVNLTIVKSKAYATDDSINYIYFTTNYIVFIVNDYKTRAVYGPKKFKITSRPVINACKILLDDEDEYKLIPASNINAFIQSRTLNKMGSGMYFKSVVSELYRNGKKNEIRNLCASRGTNVATCEKEYTIDLTEN